MLLSNYQRLTKNLSDSPIMYYNQLIFSTIRRQCGQIIESVLECRQMCMVAHIYIKYKQIQ